MEIKRMMMGRGGETETLSGEERERKEKRSGG